MQPDLTPCCCLLFIVPDFLSQRPPYDDDTESVTTVEHDYDPSKHNPVFFSDRDQLVAKVSGKK